VAEYSLNVETRADTGKGVARKLRAAGRIPGVCYGPSDPQPIVLDPRALDLLLRRSTSGMNTLIDLRVTGGGAFDGKTVLIKEVQRDPITNAPLHADFFALDMTHTIDVEVPIYVTGTAVGVSLMGGILDHVLREIEVECLPGSIPDEIVVDVSALDIGDSIHIRDLVLPAGVELRSDPVLSVVSVVAPKAIEDELPEAEEAAAAAPEGEEASAADEGDRSGDDGND